MSKKTTTAKIKKQEADVSDIISSYHQTLLASLKLDIKYKNETQKKLATAIKKNDVTICVGEAGTGKTLISVYEALMLMKTFPNIYKEIKLVKSITQLKHEELGTLPGDEKDKLKFHMMSYLDAFYKLIGEANTNKLIENGLVKFEVFGTIRGRSFSNCIIVLDEFQNITHDNAKTFLTRFSDDTKVIVLGDSGQIDLKNKKESSLRPLADKIMTYPTEGVSVIEFGQADIVRHRLTSYFINLYKEEEPLKFEKEPKENKKIKEKKSFFNFFKKILNQL